MSKIQIAGDALVITSSKRFEDIKTLEKFNPKALKLVEKDEEDGHLREVFKIFIGATGAIANNGVAFTGPDRSPDGLATATIQLPVGLEKPKEYVAEKYGAAIMALNALEAKMGEALDALQAERTKVMENITVAG